MTSFIFFFIFIPLLSVILLSVNFILAPHKPYKEKKTPFECGYHSFLAQNRTPFNISFLVFGLLFLVFDLEIVLIYPFTVSSITNSTFGLVVMIIFAIVVTVGFVYEIGKGALKIYSKQDEFFINTQTTKDKYLLINKELKSGFDGLWKIIQFLITWIFTYSLVAAVRTKYICLTCSWSLLHFSLGLYVISLLSYIFSTYLFGRKRKLTGYLFVTAVNILIYIYKSNPELLDPIISSYNFISSSNISIEDIKNIRFLDSVDFIFASMIARLLYIGIISDDSYVFIKENLNIVFMENNNDQNTNTSTEGSSKDKDIFEFIDFGDSDSQKSNNPESNNPELDHVETDDLESDYNDELPSSSSSSERNTPKYDSSSDEKTRSKPRAERNEILEKHSWDFPKEKIPGLYNSDWDIPNDHKDSDPTNMDKACNVAEKNYKTINRQQITAHMLGKRTFDEMVCYVNYLQDENKIKNGFLSKEYKDGDPRISNTTHVVGNVRGAFRDGIDPRSSDSYETQAKNNRHRSLKDHFEDRDKHDHSNDDDQDN